MHALDVPLSKTAKRVFMKMARKIGHCQSYGVCKCPRRTPRRTGRLLVKEMKFPAWKKRRGSQGAKNK